MDLGPLSVSVVVACLLAAASCSAADKTSCPCPEIPQRNLTEDPPQKCFQRGEKYRYACVNGHVRKAGTSNLITCNEGNGKLQWSTYRLLCIPDPKLKTIQPPTATVTTISTSPPTTLGGSTLFSETTELNNVVLTSTPLETSDYPQDPVQPTHLQTTASTDQTASTSNTVSSNERRTAAAISCASLVIICSLVGLCFCWYKRRTALQKRNPSQQAAEEQLPMYPASA